MTQDSQTQKPLKIGLLVVALLAGAGLASWATVSNHRHAADEAPTLATEAETPSSPTESSPKAPDPAQVRTAVAKGLAYLSRTQDPRTGAWIQDVGYKRGSAYVVTADSKPHVGVTSLALMAFLAGGHLPGRGKYGRTVERGVDFVLSAVELNTGFISGNMTRMYSHAFATLLLAEIYGMTHREDVKAKLQLAIDLIVKSQNAAGSWRYQPFSRKADMSITVCQIMALRAARNVGIRVPKSTIDRAYVYVQKSAYKRPTRRNFGGFRYKLESNARTTFPLTAAGIASLNHAGIYDNDLVKAGIGFLKSTMPRFNRDNWQHYFYFYGHYYASQVFFLCSSDDNDDLWQWYWSRMSSDLLGHQQNDGSWQNATGPGTSFSTAVACVILQIPNQYLPIFHR